MAGLRRVARRGCCLAGRRDGRRGRPGSRGRSACQGAPTEGGGADRRSGNELGTNAQHGSPYSWDRSSVSLDDPAQRQLRLGWGLARRRRRVVHLQRLLQLLAGVRLAEPPAGTCDLGVLILSLNVPPASLTSPP